MTSGSERVNQHPTWLVRYRVIPIHFRPMSGSIRQQSYRLSLTLKTCLMYQFPRDSSLQIEAVTSVLSTLRQWCGLVYLRKSLLAVDILSPRRLGNFGLRDYVGEVVASQVNGSLLSRRLTLSLKTASTCFTNRSVFYRSTTCPKSA